MIAYLGSLVGARAVAVASVPALSEWALAMLAILLMGFAAFQLRFRRGERVNCLV
jgi:hypothetical protein